MKISRIPAALVALAIIIGAGSTGAYADQPDVPHPASVPDEVLSWFDTYALAEVASTMASTTNLPRPDGIDYSRGSIGDPHPVYAWTQEFLEGAEAADPVEQVDEWVAPILVDGSPVATISAWRNPDTGRIEMASFNEDVATTAQALVEQPDDAIVVQDRDNGTFFVEGDTVTQAVESEGEIVEATLDSAQDQLAEQRDDIQRAEEASGAQLMGMSPLILRPDHAATENSRAPRTVLIAGGAVILLAGATALVLTRNRRGPQRDGAA